MHRIIINSPPRAANTYFFNHLRDSFFHNDFDHANPREAGEWSQRDSWVIICHEPLLFLADIPSVVQTTVLRNPVDFLSSIINKHSYGFGDKTIVGKPNIVEEHIEQILKDKDGWLNENLHQESMMWEGYTYNARKAIDRIYPFTFEQVTNNIIPVIQTLHDAVAEADPSRDPVRIRTPQEIAMFDNFQNDYLMKNDPGHAKGATNSLPVEKEASYYEIRKAVEQFERMPRLMDLYNDTLEKTLKRQESFRFL